jgi:hypothetical protein
MVTSSRFHSEIAKIGKKTEGILGVNPKRSGKPNFGCNMVFFAYLT